MRLRRCALWAILAFVLGLWLPRPARALSCIPVSEIIAMMDVIVRGTITAIPAEGQMELAVTGYLKGGSGAPSLRAEVPGIGRGQRMDWWAEPKVGDELIVGFVQKDGGLQNNPCHLFVQLGHQSPLPQEVRQLIAQSPQPGPELPQPPQPAGPYLLPVAGLVASAIWWIARKRLHP